uniref:hypothetical protein n=2 Tax=Flavobacterium sp. TaxID=239 RepID=UPI00404B520E
MEFEFTNQKKVEENFNSIFNNKGIFAAVAEKSINNYKSKFNVGQSIQPNLHYFAIGHTFKNIDSKSIFDYKLSENEKDLLPTKYLSLQQANFSFSSNGNINNDVLWELLDRIRNINAHFTHNFNLIDVSQLDNKVLNFILESFEVALINGIFAKKYGNKKKNLKVDFLNNEQRDLILSGILDNLDSELIQFMKEIFYQTLYTKKENIWGKNAQNNKQKKHFLDSNLKTKEDCIEWILFNKVEENLAWTLNPNGDDTTNNHVHKILDITSGKYLSFEGCLFIMSMFLYANEANYLIPKLKGFKKNETPEDASKLEVFRFFSKKFKSQDVDSEHNQFVKFRDMVQYLGKYPTVWNNLLHLENYYVPSLRNTVLENEIIRLYINDIKSFFVDKYGINFFEENKDRIHQIFIEIAKDLTQKKAVQYNGDFLNDCKTILNTSAEYLALQRQLKDINSQLKKLQSKAFELQNSVDKSKIRELAKSRYKTNDKLKKEESKKYINTTTDKFKKRIEEKLLYISNGRNNDRFMEFAVRFLAEIKYFGKDAQFKMYENYFTEEEQIALKLKEETLDKKAFDKLHYHGGKLTHFCTYEKHLEKYPDWDMPFVVQNNAVYVKISGINYQKDASFCIQRDLLNYLVEHALTFENPAYKGKFLLDYYQSKSKDYEEGILLLNENNPIDSVQKKSLKKLFPKRLLHNYCPPEKKEEQIEISFKKYLNQAILAEEKYEAQYKMASAENRLDLFLNKNKGKQFKLRFVFRAWQLMYFKEQYQKQKEGQAVLDKKNNQLKNKEHEFGHHKDFNITRDEFNLFSKWLFAMDEVPQYKEQLSNLLYKKQVFEYPEFKKLFESSNDLQSIYIKTKSAFENWLKTKSNQANKVRFQLDNYKNMMEVGNIHINLSHFLEFAVKKGIVKKEGKKIIRPITKHATHLYQSFYEIDLQHEAATNVEKNIFRKLYKNRLEDCLLYEIALRNLQPDEALREKSCNHLSQLLTQDIAIDVKDIDNNTYTLKVPFKDLEKFAQIQYLDNQRNEKGILIRLPNYLNQVDKNKEQVTGLKDMIDEFKLSNSITLANMSMLNNHLITQQGRYTFCLMAMEEYFIWKEKVTIANQSENGKPENRIVIYNIKTLKDYFTEDASRNNAFHMDLPINKTYKSAFIEKEKRFVKTELKPFEYKILNDCPYMLKKTLLVFMGQMHDEIKMKNNNRDSEAARKEKRINAENEFFNEIIKYS